MASFDAWIKYYRPDENSNNTSVSYYTKGTVIAFLLDAQVRKATSGARYSRRATEWLVMTDEAMMAAAGRSRSA